MGETARQAAMSLPLASSLHRPDLGCHALSSIYNTTLIVTPGHHYLYLPGSGRYTYLSVISAFSLALGAAGMRLSVVGGRGQDLLPRCELPRRRGSTGMPCPREPSQNTPNSSTSKQRIYLELLAEIHDALHKSLPRRHSRLVWRIHRGQDFVRTARTLGIFRTPQNTPVEPENLMVIEGTAHCEDLHYNAASNRLFAACEGPSSRRHSWFPPMAIFDDPVAAMGGGRVSPCDQSQR